MTSNRAQRFFSLSTELIGSLSRFTSVDKMVMALFSVSVQSKNSRDSSVFSLGEVEFYEPLIVMRKQETLNIFF
jgi:hypothetical protein